MDYVSGALAGPPGDKLKLVTTAQLVLALVVSFWGLDFSAVVAVIGLLAVVLSHPELLRLFFYLESASFLVTFLRLFLRWRQTWGVAFALLLEVVLQGVAAWYAYSLLNDVGGGDSYAAFGGDGHGGRSDPFQSYEPPATNNGYQASEQHQAPQQQQPQQQQPQQQQPPNLV